MREQSVYMHGVAWRFRGIPRYDDPDDPEQITGYLEVEKWREEDLTPDQLAEVDTLVGKARAQRPDIPEPKVRWLILEQEGIEHAHRWGPIPDYRGPGRACVICDVYEVPRPSVRPSYRVIDRPVINGEAVLSDGRVVKSPDKIVREAVLERSSWLDLAGRQRCP